MKNQNYLNHNQTLQHDVKKYYNKTITKNQQTKKQQPNNIHSTTKNIKQSSSFQSQTITPPQSHPYYLQHTITYNDTSSITPPQSHPYYLQREYWYKKKMPDSSPPIVSSYHPPIEEEVS